METYDKQIMAALESFFKDDSANVVEYMESILFEWYQHHALEYHKSDHINEVVNEAFRVNELLLKLQDIMLAMKEDQSMTQEQDLKKDHPQGDHFDYRFAS
jgi:hypothetical protein